MPTAASHLSDTCTSHGVEGKDEVILKNPYLQFIISLALYFLIYLIKVVAAKKRHFAVPPGADGNLIYDGHDNVAFSRTS